MESNHSFTKSISRLIEITSSTRAQISSTCLAAIPTHHWRFVIVRLHYWTWYHWFCQYQYLKWARWVSHLLLENTRDLKDPYWIHLIKEMSISVIRKLQQKHALNFESQLIAWPQEKKNPNKILHCQMTLLVWKGLESQDFLCRKINGPIYSHVQKT